MHPRELVTPSSNSAALAMRRTPITTCRYFEGSRLSVEWAKNPPSSVWRFDRRGASPPPRSSRSGPDRDRSRSPRRSDRDRHLDGKRDRDRYADERDRRERDYRDRDRYADDRDRREKYADDRDRGRERRKSRTPPLPANGDRYADRERRRSLSPRDRERDRDRARTPPPPPMATAMAEPRDDRSVERAMTPPSYAR
ncbi:pre-mrna splicing factor [Moniliophthora roreri]|nr:pre-mrna splicing factor [Moniliophthora roreri]